MFDLCGMTLHYVRHLNDNEFFICATVRERPIHHDEAKFFKDMQRLQNQRFLLNLEYSLGECLLGSQPHHRSNPHLIPILD